MRILRLSSVFEPSPAALAGRGAAFDPIGGMQNHTGALTRALDDLGTTQTVVTSRLGGPSEEVPFGARATVVRVGAPVRHVRQLWAVEAARWLRSRSDETFDVVHAHQGEDVALLPLAIAAARRFDAALVVTVHCSVRHTLAPLSLRNRVLRALGGPVEGRGLRAADRVITLSRLAADRLAIDGLDPARVTVIPSGFERRLFDMNGGRPAGAAAALTGLSRPRVGYVGRFAPQKDVVGLVRALDLVRTAGASLVLVGDGPDRSVVDAAIAGAAHRDRICSMGFVPHDQVPAVLAELDLMVLPSRYEELGSVLVEGLRAGLPIVATDVGGIPEVVRHGDNGLLVPPADPAALAAAIDRVLSDPALAARLSANARAGACAYGWDDLARSVLTTYEAAAGAPRPALVS